MRGELSCLNKFPHQEQEERHSWERARRVKAGMGCNCVTGVCGSWENGGSGVWKGAKGCVNQSGSANFNGQFGPIQAF